MQRAILAEKTYPRTEMNLFANLLSFFTYLDPLSALFQKVNFVLEEGGGGLVRAETQAEAS